MNVADWSQSLSQIPAVSEGFKRPEETKLETFLYRFLDLGVPRSKKPHLDI